MVDMTNWPPARVIAYEQAIQANERKISKVYDVDSYWRELRQKPTIHFTDEQRQQVESFWNRYSYAYQNNLSTQEYYYSMSGTFDPRYCAEGLNAYYMYRFYDDPVYHTAFHDKNYREFLFKDFRYTPAVLHRIRRNFYDEKFRPVSYHEAVRLLKAYLDTRAEKVIVKPTPGGGGNGISFLRRGDSLAQISQQLDSIEKDDIIIEEFINAHESYSIANPTSLNTLRIVSFFYEHEVAIISIVFRMGATGNEVDNFTQGGIACRVSLDGICGDYAVDHFGRKYDRHPNGFAFAGHLLVGVREAVEMVKQLHWRVPQFRQMSWDIAVEKDGKPTLIEMNPRGDIAVYQVFGDLPFGERTQEILDDYLVTNFYNIGAEKDWDFKEYTDHIVLTKYAGTDKIVKVPETIHEKSVTTIAAGCFSENSEISEIIIPGNVKTFPDGLEKTFPTSFLEDTRGIVIPAPKELKTETYPDGNLLSWTPVEGVTNYRIFRTDRGMNKRLLKNAASCVRSWKDRDVLQNEVYYYEVYGYDSSVGMMSVESASSFAPGVNPEQFQLGAPENIRGTATPGKNTLRWTAVEDAVGYYVYRMKLGEEMRLLASVNGDTLAYVDEDVIPGETYHYRIRTIGPFGVLSDETGRTAVCAVSEEQFRLGAPKNVCGTTAPGRNTLCWTAVEGAIGYYVYRMKLGEEMRFLASVNGDTLEFADENVVPGDKYLYRIRTVGSFGVLSNEAGRIVICAAGENSSNSEHQNETEKK